VHHFNLKICILGAHSVLFKILIFSSRYYSHAVVWKVLRATHPLFTLKRSAAARDFIRRQCSGRRRKSGLQQQVMCVSSVLESESILRWEKCKQTASSSFMFAPLPVINREPKIAVFRADLKFQILQV